MSSGSAGPVGLICVDVQNDFCEGGSLPVSGGAQVAADLAKHLVEHRGDYALVVASRDWHVSPGAHFSAHPDFHSSWPVHCVADSDGAQLHAAFARAVDNGLVDVVVDKGRMAAAYSAFEAVDDDGQSLATLLRDAGVSVVVVTGLATDYCVRATALDAVAAGYPVTLETRLAAGVAPATTAAAIAELTAAGVTVH